MHLIYINPVNLLLNEGNPCKCRSASRTLPETNVNDMPKMCK